MYPKELTWAQEKTEEFLSQSHFWHILSEKSFHYMHAAMIVSSCAVCVGMCVCIHMYIYRVYELRCIWWMHMCVCSSLTFSSAYNSCVYISKCHYYKMFYKDRFSFVLCFSVLVTTLEIWRNEALKADKPTQKSIRVTFYFLWV